VGAAASTFGGVNRVLKVNDRVSLPEVLAALVPEAHDLSWSVLDLGEVVPGEGRAKQSGRARLNASHVRLGHPFERVSSTTGTIAQRVRLPRSTPVRSWWQCGEPSRLAGLTLFERRFHAAFHGERSGNTKTHPAVKSKCDLRRSFGYPEQPRRARSHENPAGGAPDRLVPDVLHELLGPSLRLDPGRL
jgi:hypothetical protein